MEADRYERTENRKALPGMDRIRALLEETHTPGGNHYAVIPRIRGGSSTEIF
ncbi:hypothetical protein P7H19_07020 [Paenibacillus larvae]|nr:hypothetical protein [Paenibacillus larvae]MDT2236098.1 hypothetical protein [Paenibacillus larvae]